MSTLATVFAGEWIAGLIITIVLVVGIIVLSILVFRKDKKNKVEAITPLDVAEKEEKQISEEISPDEEDVKGDVINLLARRTYTVGKYNKVKPGRYHAAAASDDENKLMIRLNDFVKEYEDQFEISLAEGETICAVSKSVTLTPVIEASKQEQVDEVQDDNADNE